MIIDMHTHCFPDPLAKKAMPMLAIRSVSYTHLTLPTSDLV